MKKKIFKLYEQYFGHFILGLIPYFLPPFLLVMTGVPFRSFIDKNMRAVLVYVCAPFSILLTIAFLYYLNKKKKNVVNIKWLGFVNFKINNEIFTNLIDIATVFCTFFIFIDGLFTLEEIVSSWQFTLLFIYPVNIGSKLYKYFIIPFTESEVYKPHRKWH